MSAYEFITDNMVSYDDICFILCNVTPYVNAICHMSASYGLIIRNIVQNVGIWFILRSMSSYVDIGFIMRNIVPICRHMIYKVGI